tara:strand:+ start:19848 stop:20306 length:459 start_codon:yes stop_codon:yes gene_type:complete
MNGLTMLIEVKDAVVRTNPFLVKLIGSASILFFGVIIYIASKQLFNPELGISLDEDGMNDHSNGMAVGMINWANITSIETNKFLWMKSLVIHTDNPEKYLGEASGLKLRVLAGNLNRTKTPIVISTRNLKMKHSEFKQLVEDFWSVSKSMKS